MTANHLDNITINITLAPAPLQIAGFGIPLLIVDGATSSLGGDRVRTYAGTDGAQADNTAGELSAAALAGVTAAFSQRTSPALVKVGLRDATDAYDVALAEIIAFDPDFYGVAIESRAAADQLLVSTAVEASNRLFVLQSSDADWKTPTLPAAYTALAGVERTAVVYHDTDAAWGDLAWLANRLVFDPDIKSAPWDAAVQGVASYATAPTAGEKINLDNNFANNGLIYGAENFFIDAGVNAAGRALHEIETADWFDARLREAVVGVKTAASARGDKIVIGPTGQGQLLAEISALFQRGVNAGHFISGQTSQKAETITQADFDLGRLRFSGAGQLASSARLFTFNFNFGRAPLT
tara:strand:+ start:5754 stop:6812 length:1059 start_codon:yes stop_codon:yes gene_type:complete